MNLISCVNIVYVSLVIIVYKNGFMILVSSTIKKQNIYNLHLKIVFECKALNAVGEGLNAGPWTSKHPN